MCHNYNVSLLIVVMEGDRSATWSPMIVDARTLAQSMAETQNYDGQEVSVGEENSECALLMESGSISHSGSELKQDLSERRASKSTSTVITKKPSVHNHSSRFKPIDIVSAAFEHAELDQFDPSDGNI
jgi:hypothetical protein